MIIWKPKISYIFCHRWKHLGLRPSSPISPSVLKELHNWPWRKVGGGRPTHSLYASGLCYKSGKCFIHDRSFSFKVLNGITITRIRSISTKRVVVVPCWTLRRSSFCLMQQSRRKWAPSSRLVWKWSPSVLKTLRGFWKWCKRAVEYVLRSSTMGKPLKK